MTQVKDLSKLQPGQKVIHFDINGNKEIGIVIRHDESRVWCKWDGMELYFWHNTGAKLYYATKLDEVLE